MLAVLEMLDKKNARIRNEGKIEGKIEGEKEGKKQGILESKIKIAKNMLKEKFAINMISKITGLKKEEIEKIQKNIEKQS